MIVVPHLPATCARCLALCSPAERAVARIVLKLISTGPLNDQVYFMPRRTPLCERAQQEEEPDEVRVNNGE